MELDRCAPRITPPRFSIASLLSIRTVLPQYTAVDTLEDPSTASVVNADSRGPPPYGPSSTDIRISASTTRPLCNNFSSTHRWSSLPQYSAVDILQEPARPSPSNIRTSASAGATERGREVTLTWRASTLLDTSEFQYSYPIRPKKPWATLHLQTRDEVLRNPNPLQSQPRVPRLWSCDPVMGSLKLDLDSPQNIQQINISLNGSIVMSSVSKVEFLGHEFTLWDKLMGDPLHSDNASTLKKKFEGRFAPGQYTFPFSFSFPTHPHTTAKSSGLNASSISPFPPPVVNNIQSTIPSPTLPLSEHVPKNMSWTSRSTSSSVSPPGKAEPSAQIQTSGPSQTLDMSRRGHRSLASPLPQSFMEKGIKPSVSYEISVSIVHGRFKASSKIRTDIVYIPALQPLPASQKRREAYEAGALLPHPMDDSEGWFAWPTLNLYGVINPDVRPRHTKAECTLFLAQPLSYTRGSVIPCFLTISSDDDEVVHLLSNPNAPTVRLLRRIRHPMEEDEAATERTSEDPRDLMITWRTWRPHTTTTPTGGMKLVKHEVGRARWWMPLKDVAQGPNVRHLEGEIHLSQNLQPSCDFRFFQVEYAVELLSFQTADFEPEIHPSSLGKLNKGDSVLASNPVEITTLYRQDEPVPTSYSEPPKINTRRAP